MSEARDIGARPHAPNWRQALASLCLDFVSPMVTWAFPLLASVLCGACRERSRKEAHGEAPMAPHNPAPPTSTGSDPCSEWELGLGDVGGLAGVTAPSSHSIPPAEAVAEVAQAQAPKAPRHPPPGDPVLTPKPLCAPGRGSLTSLQCLEAPRTSTSQTELLWPHLQPRLW